MAAQQKNNITGVYQFHVMKEYVLQNYGWKIVELDLQKLD